MELFIPDALVYLSLAIMTAFFVHAAIKLATFQTIHKHVCLQQKDMYLIQNVNLLRAQDLICCVYYKFKFIYSVHRQEAIGEQDDEGPHSPVFF
ncbi:MULTISPECIES: hypothetical protein [Priestia]|uniref:hypothetical protein n=1 Tax=Priestia TaxID=2800373 RepID=UPI001C8D3AAF|nr:MULTISPECIES: hypothetical protein [Priestia]MBX9996631.1 hypothetical protein [Priestia aryabhattai]